MTYVTVCKMPKGSFGVSGVNGDCLHSMDSVQNRGKRGRAACVRNVTACASHPKDSFDHSLKWSFLQN